MIHLVTMELIGGPPTSPQDMVQHLEQRIIPTHEALMKLQAQKIILAGGDMSGRRGTAFIVNTASNEELTKLLMSLPMWALMKVEVTPLENFEERQARHREFLDHMKEIL
jgi:muconolactone D-isomerase